MKPRALLALLVALVACRDASAPRTNGTANGDAGVGPTGASSTALEIHFLNVGQGDAILLRNGTKAALIDAGPTDDVVKQLRALHVDTISLFVASHNHSDHIGGADAVLDSFPVRFYLDNGDPSNSRIQKRVLDRVEKKGVTYLAPEHRRITLGSTVLHILPPPEEIQDTDQNDHSVVVLVEQGRFHAVLSGDSEQEELGDLMKDDTIPDVDVMKAAHHGSRNGVNPAWLARTRPEVVMISDGVNNSYGHPHADAMKLYCVPSRRVYRTDVHGEITVRVTAAGAYTVSTQKQGNGCTLPPWHR